MDELTIIWGDQTVVLQPGQTAHVGRSGSSSLVVDDPRVSRDHLRVSWTSGGWLLESVGRSGTFVSDRPVSRFVLGGATDVRLAASDGPLVRFEPAPAPPVGVAAVGAPTAAGAEARIGAPPVAPGTERPHTPPVGHLGGSGEHVRPSGDGIKGAFATLLPLRTWFKDPEFRRWYRLVVVVYAMAPLAFILLNTGNFKTLGWVYSLYIAPLWVLVFWYLIRPGRLGRLELTIAAIFVGAEYILVPVVTLPWEDHLAPSPTSHNLIQYIYGVGLPEEITKVLPVIVIAYLLLRVRHRKIDSRMWMFLATISGLMFGVSEAAGYVSQALVGIARGGPIVGAIQEFAERVFVDGLQHAVWAGIAGFFIGLGINYRRQRIPLWLFGILLPSVLHGLNDWSLSGTFGTTNWGVGTNPVPWLVIQAVSLFLFLGYTATAGSIERQVRHTPIFRGESLYQDPSRLQQPPPTNP